MTIASLPGTPHKTASDLLAERELSWSAKFLFAALKRLLLILPLLAVTVQADEPAQLKIATFRVDATPPLGSPVAYAPARKIEDPLWARGIVLLGSGQPVVLCAFDWIGIGNSGNLVLREKLAAAAGTTPDRVTVHTLHQHDGVRCDFRTEELMAQLGFNGKKIDEAFCRQTIDAIASAIQKAIPQAQPVTHLGVGKAIVEKVASNRRVLGPDGKVKLVRFSSAAKNPDAREAPEGLIDPELKLISFWNGDKPLASLTYYATHPQSYYGKGDVTSEFVGLARARREAALPDFTHIHFNGASGNVAAGKYNDGSPEMRITLTDRMEAGMKQAWENTVKTPISLDQVSWKTTEVHLPVAEHVKLDELKGRKPKDTAEAFSITHQIAWGERDDGHGVPVLLTCLTLGGVRIIHMPGELFIEYQLAAQKMRMQGTVCMAAYGDYGPGYIGTEVAYSQGGYETSPRASLVAPQVERELLRGMGELLDE